MTAKMDREIMRMDIRHAAAKKGLIKRDIRKRMIDVRIYFGELESLIDAMDSNDPTYFDRLREAAGEVGTRAMGVMRKANAWGRRHENIQNLKKGLER